MPRSVQQVSIPALTDPLSKATVYIVNDLGSDTTNYRLILRSCFSDQLQAAGFPLPANSGNLNQSLSHSHLHLSLSHTTDASAMAWVENSLRIGVDIEVLDRLQNRVIERVSLLDEREQAPDARFLWSAKEATFKCISPRCQVISDIEIFSWKSVDANTWSYSARLAGSDQTIDGCGLICLNSRHLLSFFVSTP